MSRSRIASTVFLFAAFAVLTAQEEVKEKDRPSFGPPVKENPPAAVEVAPAPQQAPDADPFAPLLTWPSESAQNAARGLSQLGQAMAAQLTANLDHGDWRIRAGSAFALGEKKEVAAYPRIKKGLEEIGNQIAIATFFGALAKIDPVAAVGDLLPFLAAGSPGVARDAFEAMPKDIDARFVPRLREVADANDETTRWRAVELLRRVVGGVDWRVFQTLLSDKSAKVCYSSAQALSLTDGPEVIEALKKDAVDGGLRRTCYATLALVMLEDRIQKPILDGEGKFVDKMMKYLRIRGDLENAVGAIALANVSMRSKDQKIREIADKVLVVRLIDTAAGGVIFSDYTSVRELAYKKAAMLSGKNFGEDAEAWKSWWNQYGESFTALRQLSDLGESDIDRLVVEYVRRAPGGDDFIAVIAAAPQQGPDGAMRPTAVGKEIVRDVVAELTKLDFFGTISDLSRRDSSPLSITVRIDRAERRRDFVTVDEAAIKSLEEKMRSVVAREAWQLLWAQKLDGPLEAWIASRRDELAAMNDSARTKWCAEHALATFASIDTRGRKVAIAAWRAQDPAFIAENGQKLLLALRAKGATKDDGRSIVRLLATAPLGENKKIVEDYLLTQSNDPELPETFVDAQATSDVVAYLKDRRFVLRSAAIATMSRRIDDPAVCIAIVDGIGSYSPEVQDVVVAAFKSTRPPALIEALRKLVGDKDSPKRLQAIEMLAAMSNDQEIAILAEILREGGISTGFAVMRGLKSSGSDKAVETLADAARSNSDENIRREALIAFARIESEKTREILRAWLKEEKDLDRLKDLVSVAPGVFGKSVGKELGFLLAHGDPSMRESATLVLAAAGQSEAVPGLIDLLFDPASSAAAEEYLQQIACRRIAGETPDEKRAGWTTWWEAHKSEEPDQWFCDALLAKKLPVGDLLRFLRGERQDAQAVPLLVHVVKDEAWELRVRAHQYLTRISGQNFGTLTRRTSSEETRRTVERWEKWQRTWELRR